MKKIIALGMEHLFVSEVEQYLESRIKARENNSISQSELFEAISVNSVAAHYDCTTRSFIRKLSLLETSFSEIRERVRLKLALEYLHNAAYSALHICFLIGYRDKSAFSCLFKRKFGCSPQQYRNANGLKRPRIDK